MYSFFDDFRPIGHGPVSSSQVGSLPSARNTYMVVGALLVTCIIGFIFVGYQERREGGFLQAGDG